MTAEARVKVDLFLLSGQVGQLDAATALAATVDYAQAAEAAGFDGLWLAEHHFITYGSCPSAMAMAAYVLGRTSRIHVGTAAAILSNRHPVALAEEAALLDIVSGGRFLLGVGRGGPWVDLEVFGTGLHRFERGFTESLDLLLRTVSGTETVSANGELFRFRPVSIVPRPERPLPVWVAATSPQTMQLAAHRGLPLLLGLHEDAHTHAATLNAYAQINPAPAPHAVAQLASTASPERLRTILSHWLARTLEYQRIAAAPSASNDIGQYVERLLRLHPPQPIEALTVRLRAVAQTSGAARLMLLVEATDEPAEALQLIEELGNTLVEPAGRPLHQCAGRRNKGHV